MRRFAEMIGGRRRLLFSLLLVGTIAAGGVSVSGAASTPSGQGTVVYVVARSGSMGTPSGACGTRLACVKAAITTANAALGDSSSVAWTGLAAANPSGAARDVNFGARGTQLLVRPSHDGNHNGRADLADAAHRMYLGGATCYACGLDAAQSIVASAPAASSQNVIVFIADRPNQVGPALSTVAGTFDANTVIRAVAIGPRTTCGAQQLKVGRGGRTEVWVGSLAPVANLTPGGSCVHVSAAETAAAIGAATG